MAKLLTQEKLATAARSRGERRELMVGEAETAYWFYPAEFGAASSRAVAVRTDSHPVKQLPTRLSSLSHHRHCWILLDLCCCPECRLLSESAGYWG